MTQLTQAALSRNVVAARNALDNAYAVYFAAKSACDATRDAYYAADRALKSAQEASRDARDAYDYAYSLDSDGVK